MRKIHSIFILAALTSTFTNASLAIPETDVIPVITVDSIQNNVAETIDLQGYADTVLKRITSLVLAPQKAEDARDPGIRIWMTNKGLVLHSWLVKSSGNDLLDKSMEDAVYYASPYGPCPNVSGKNILILDVISSLNRQTNVRKTRAEIIEDPIVKEAAFEKNFDFNELFSLLQQNKLEATDEYFNKRRKNWVVKYAIAKCAWMNLKYALITGDTKRFSNSITELASLYSTKNTNSDLKLLVEKICEIVSADKKSQHIHPLSLAVYENSIALGSLMKTLIESITN